jgi:hypothetical protein
MSVTGPDSNKAAFGRVVEAANSYDEELLSTVVDDVFAPDALIATPIPLEVQGPQAIKQVFATLHRAFPDLHVKIEDAIAEGDRVVSRHTVTGTHLGGEYLGVAPTGKTVAYDEVFIVRFDGGRITQTWGLVDLMTQMKQLGVVAPPPD